MVEGPVSKNNNLIVKEENNKTLDYYLGQVVGIVADPLTGHVREKLRSPMNGLLFTLREYPVVYSGSLIARVLGGAL